MLFLNSISLFKLVTMVVLLKEIRTGYHSRGMLLPSKTVISRWLDLGTKGTAGQRLQNLPEAASQQLHIIPEENTDAGRYQLLHG